MTITTVINARQCKVLIKLPWELGERPTDTVLDEFQSVATEVARFVPEWGLTPRHVWIEQRTLLREVYADSNEVGLIYTFVHAPPAIAP